MCRKHGGATPGGIGSASWKTGKYSKYIPTGLRERYESEASDPELLALNDEIALARSRLSSLLEKIGTMPDSGSTWRELRKSFNRFEAAQKAIQRLPEGAERDRKLGEASKALEQTRLTIKRGAAEWAAWGEVISLTKQVRKLSESEQKRRVAGEYILQMHDVMALFDYVVNLINDVVSNPKEKSRLSEGLRRFSSRMDGEQALLEKRGREGPKPD
ncbi:MAG: hypothetical protein IMY80_06630 [Chloroflexi bacterium]|nr:hypothetical protein [Chloroflexota bacterium]